MSDIGSRVQIARPASQLPVDWYFDQNRYQHELERLFAQGPRYIGHELWVPESGDYYALPQEDSGRALVRNENGVELISNVCRHRQAIMLEGRGSTGKNIVCPLHRWTYNLQGELVGAPHFEQKPCLHLQKFPLTQWNGLLFEDTGGSRQLLDQVSQSKFAPYFDFSGYKLHRIERHECHYNWKTFIEVYLEDYHVVPFHPGLGQFVNCGNLEWEFGSNYSVQTVGLKDTLSKPGSKVYERWHQVCKQWYADSGKSLPELGAIWMTLYPNMMLEWYPGVLCISTLFPQGTGKTLNTVEFYYPEEIVDFEPEFIAAEQAAYMETAVEDDEIAERMDRGRLQLYRRGVSEVGPYQSPFEDGMQHFHEYLRRELAP
jgi:phenylpropionate dioxygenase-like ring-hydroxylating dioxygenase large terminal subunit